MSATHYRSTINWVDQQSVFLTQQKRTRHNKHADNKHAEKRLLPTAHVDTHLLLQQLEQSHKHTPHTLLVTKLQTGSSSSSSEAVNSS